MRTTLVLRPWVLGELALGQLGSKRAAILGDLRLVRAAPVVPDADVIALIDARRLSLRIGVSP